MTLEKIVRLTEPTTEPVTLEEAKRQLRIESDFTEEDDYINAIIPAAREYVENYTNQWWAEAKISLYFSSFPAGDVPLNLLVKNPKELDAVKYLDGSQEEQTLTGAVLDSGRGELRYTAGWPLSISSQVDITIGPDHGASPPEDCPKAIKQAVLMFITTLFENRATVITGTMVNENPAALALMQPYRVMIGI